MKMMMMVVVVVVVMSSSWRTFVSLFVAYENKRQETQVNQKFDLIDSNACGALYGQ